jgi:hypothetical protein
VRAMARETPRRILGSMGGGGSIAEQGRGWAAGGEQT